jgi:glycine betaine/proline transport system permease protein
VQDGLSGLTNAFRDAISYGLLNPFQSLLTDSPWWLVAAVLIALGVVLGGWRAGAVAAVCVGLLVGTGLWSDAMTTLASTLVATVLVMVLGMAFGVWMGRSLLVDRVLRPTLDAAQVMPPFVYLVPFLALFGATRFTAIVAAIVYAAPVAIKIIADGVRAVPEATVEAATSAGCNTWQIITKVQLPMARGALTLATNQGLIYVLSMVVVGGLVGAGALGYDVVAGFSQGQLFGKGLAAGLAIVLLGVMFDRITQAAARRTSA